MNKILKLIKANKVVTIMLGVFILGGGVTAILSQCLPSYTVDKVLITEGPEDISGNAQTAGESDAFQYTIEGTAKNGGKAPTPDFTILMTSDQSVPSWLSIPDDKLKWTDEASIGEYIFIVQIKAANVESLAPFMTTLTIS